MAQKRIIVLDDNAMFRTNIRQMLNSADYDVIEASHSVELSLILEKMHPRKPHLFIIDLVLQGTTGIEVIKSLKADFRFAAVPIFLVTGKATREAVEQAMAVGVTEFMAKPINRNLLVEKLEQAIVEDRRAKWLKQGYATVNLMVIPAMEDENGCRKNLLSSQPFPFQNISNVLRALLRSQDKVVEVSPHTYAIVLPGTNAEGAKMVTKRIDDALNKVNKDQECIAWFHSFNVFP